MKKKKLNICFHYNIIRLKYIIKKVLYYKSSLVIYSNLKFLNL